MSLSGEPIVILGVYRSGTSSVAGTLVKLGLYMGSEQALFPADEFNPDGHWELRDMMTLHERLLMAFRMNYYAATWLPPNWQDMPFLGAMTQEIKALLSKNFTGQTRWGWKEPATSMLLPLYKRALQEEGTQGRYLFVVRHPRSVLASMIKRFAADGNQGALSKGEGFSEFEERMLGMILSYMLSSLKETQGCPRQILIYERYLQDPRTYLQRIATDLLPWNPTPEQMDAAVALVKPQLSHSKFQPGEDTQGWPSLLVRTYDLCLRADLDNAGLNSGAFDKEVDELWDEWMLTREMIQPVQRDPAEAKFSWLSASGLPTVHHSLFSPTGHMQTLRAQIDAPPNTRIEIDAYPEPCRLWIKKASWRIQGQERSAPLKGGDGGVLEEMPTMKRLALFGRNALITTTPSDPGPYEFELEFFMQSGQIALASIIAMLGNRIDQEMRAATPRGR